MIIPVFCFTGVYVSKKSLNLKIICKWVFIIQCPEKCETVAFINKSQPTQTGKTSNFSLSLNFYFSKVYILPRLSFKQNHSN